MNSCYGCILQLDGVWNIHPYCKSCTSEGSHYFPRPDFDAWHSENSRPKSSEAAKRGGVGAVVNPQHGQLAIALAEKYCETIPAGSIDEQVMQCFVAFVKEQQQA